mgnify:CR=1 FL=1
MLIDAAPVFEVTDAHPDFVRTRVTRCRITALAEFNRQCSVLALDSVFLWPSTPWFVIVEELLAVLDFR